MADFWDNLASAVKSATDKEKKSQAKADNLMGDFIKKYRAADSYTKSKMDDYMKDLLHPNITRPEIKNPQITPNTSGGSGNNGSSSTGKSFFEKLAEALKDTVNKAGEAVNANGGDTRQKAPGTIGAENGTDVIEYIYAPGDTFGRVLMKTGLSDGRNLWGPDGDVAYYAKQLNDQGISGNIPVGTKIKLKKRK